MIKNIFKRFKYARNLKSKQTEYVAQEFPRDYLFWGECDVQATEDGISYTYKRRDCFLGNSDSSTMFEGEIKPTFIMRKLTGEQMGGLYYPEVSGDEFVIKVPEKSGIVEYKIDTNLFELREPDDFYSLGRISDFTSSENESVKSKAREKTIERFFASQK